jgi:hypothetical protein
LDELTSIVAGEVVVAGDSIILIPVDLARTSGDTGPTGDLNRFVIVLFTVSLQIPCALLLMRKLSASHGNNNESKIISIRIL